MKKAQKKEIVIFQSKTGAIELKGDFQKETLWASLQQIADLFGRDKSVISRHIKNIFTEKELSRDSVVAFFATTATDGKTYQVEYFNLDIILSVGYRVNSKVATKFRQWATKVLRQHITKGYTINPKVIKNNYAEFQKAIENIKWLLPDGGKVDRESVLELISAFADTWLSLEAYDKNKLISKGVTKKTVAVTAENLSQELDKFKKDLIRKKQATDLFGRERQKNEVAGIFGNVMQSFGGKDLYPTVEEKAAHLLYSMVKNHPFTDGNKRSGAFAFIWFLKKAGIFNMQKINPAALTALTLFIAESAPKSKERMIRLVLQLLRI